MSKENEMDTPAETKGAAWSANEDYGTNVPRGMAALFAASRLIWSELRAPTYPLHGSDALTPNKQEQAEQERADQEWDTALDDLFTGDEVEDEERLWKLIEALTALAAGWVVEAAGSRQEALERATSEVWRLAPAEARFAASINGSELPVMPEHEPAT